MKLLRCGEDGKELPAVQDGQGKFRDLSSHITDLNPENLSLNTIEKIKKINLEKLPEIPSSTRIGPCILNPQKFIGIGLNYSDHAKETKTDVPKEPIVFFKANNSITGPNDKVYLPNGSLKSDSQKNIKKYETWKI